MRTATVYILCGFIGSGKTTFAKKLEKETGAVRITKDEWLIDLFGHDPSIPKYAEYDQIICEISRGMAFQFAKKGIDVIIDEGFWTKEQRNEMRKKIQSIGAKAILYYLNTPIEIIRKRMLKRNKKLTKDSFKISSEMFDNYLKQWQPLSEDEGYVVVNGS